MPDTKEGRERKGKNKRTQLEYELVERELDMEVEDTLPPLDGAGSDLVADEPFEQEDLLTEGS